MFVNKVRGVFNYSSISLSKNIKDNVKSALIYINDFETTAAELAVKKGYNYIVCGHIHKPENRILKTKQGKTIRYLNSGDWIENLSALEYHEGEWKIYRYAEDHSLKTNTNSEAEDDTSQILTELNNKMLFNRLIADFQN